MDDSKVSSGTQRRTYQYDGMSDFNRTHQVEYAIVRSNIRRIGVGSAMPYFFLMVDEVL